ncbi:MAG: peptidoglycan bridge formation glycyltransferase FemA/FemB family protein [Patescibacteria group bacterium]
MIFSGDREAWNRFVITHGGSFLQSWEWGNLQRSLGRQVWRIYGGGFAASAIAVPLPIWTRYCYIPYGPVFEGAAHAEQWLALKKECRGLPDASFLLFLRVEPRGTRDAFGGALRHAGFFGTGESQPRETLILDLRQEENDMLEGMEYSTRYAIRTAERRGVTVRTARDMPEKQEFFGIFWKLFQDTNLRHGLRMRHENYYRAVASLEGDCSSEIMVAEHEGIPLAAAMFVMFGDAVAYLYAASARGYGRLNAPSLVLWSAIRSAKQNGFRSFDFWGISHDNPKWAGMSAFKRGFGGKEVAYAGTWDAPLSRGLYSLLRPLNFFRHFR